jgi:hypothetical protein
MQDIGFDKDGEMWDCYINHYDYYDWSEMESYAQAAYRELGWDANIWDDGPESAYPDSEEAYWATLSVVENEAAIALCYFQENWDLEENLDQWFASAEILTDMPSTGAPTTSAPTTIAPTTSAPTSQSIGQSPDDNKKGKKEREGRLGGKKKEKGN